MAPFGSGLTRGLWAAIATDGAGSLEGSPQSGLRTNLRRLGATEAELGTLGDDFVLEADLARNRLASSAIHSSVALSTPLVAALPTFSNNPAIHPVNVEGTLALAHALNPAVLKRFLFVGTAWQSGLRGAGDR